MSIFRRRSFTETVEGRQRFLSRAGFFLVLFLVFEVVSGSFLSTFSVGSTSMSPSIAPGDRLLASPLLLGPGTVFGRLPVLSRPARGDLVLVRPPFSRDPGPFATFADSLVRFVTFQRLSFSEPAEAAALNGPFVERVIALPGDEVSMTDFVFKVRSAGSDHALTEFEFSSRRYDIHRPRLPEGWTAGDPLAGDMAPRLLAKGEYFVALDDRGATSDSRSWGPVGLAQFRSRVLLRYWPFATFGSF